MSHQSLSAIIDDKIMLIHEVLMQLVPISAKWHELGMRLRISQVNHKQHNHKQHNFVTCHYNLKALDWSWVYL